MSQSAAIISATIAMFSLVLAIFGASWLNQRNIERLLEQMEKRFDSKFEQINVQMNARFDTVLSEIRRLDQRIDSLEQRIDRIERQLEVLFKQALPPRA